MRSTHTLRTPSGPAVAFLYGAAFLSGLAALIYEVTWVKMLSLSFGSTTLAGAAVIGSFMAGMGLGAKFYDRIARRFQRPVVVYGFLELGIALSSGILSSFLYSLPSVYAQLSGAASNETTVGLVRFGIGFGLLLLPSALMGATFPALCTALIHTRQGLSRHLGPIYGINTIGGAVGALLAGLVLIEALGSRSSIWTANGLTLLAAAIAFALARSSSVSRARLPAEGVSDSVPASTTLPRALIAVTLFASGFATMAYEISWFRAARYIVGNSTYAMSCVLAIFLIGLGLGGVWHRTLTRRPDPGRDLAFAQVLIAILTLSAMALELMILSSETLSQQLSIFSRDVVFSSWPQRLGITGLTVTVLLLPSTILMGLTFPLASTLFVRSIRTLGRHIGTAYLLANAGSICGVVTGGMLLLPLLGLVGAARAIALINILLGIVLFLAGRRSSRRTRAVFGGLVATSVALVLLLPLKMPFLGENEKRGNTELIFWEEGELGTVKVLRTTDDRRSMTIDGHSIGVSRSYGHETGYKQQILAHLAMNLAPHSRRTLNVGLGSATTLASLARYPDIATLDCVEISAEVVAGARMFDEGAVLDDRRVSIRVDDAIHFLLRSRDTYDIIISDGKQNPQFAGNSALLSMEFYSLALDRLSDSGLIVQWIPLNYTPRSFAIILRTILDVFPEVSAFYLPPTCAVLVGSRQPIRIPWEMHAQEKLPFVGKDDLLPYGIVHPFQLLAGHVTDKTGLLRVLPTGEINTWDHPILEFISYKSFRAEDNPLYFHQNLKLLIDAGASERPLPHLPEARAFIESAALVRGGLLEVARTLNPETFRPHGERALFANPHDNLARLLLRRVEGGLRILMRPGRPRNRAPSPETQDSALTPGT